VNSISIGATGITTIQNNITLTTTPITYTPTQLGYSLKINSTLNQNPMTNLTYYQVIPSFTLPVGVYLTTMSIFVNIAANSVIERINAGISTSDTLSTQNFKTLWFNGGNIIPNLPSTAGCVLSEYLVVTSSTQVYYFICSVSIQSGTASHTTNVSSWGTGMNGSFLHYVKIG
jgi:hypothetical protein